MRAFTTLVLGMLSATCSLAGELRVRPAQRNVAVSPGAAAEISFQVRFLGGDRRVFPRLENFDLDLDGNPMAGTAGERSCASWARLERDELGIRADGQGEVRLRLEPPTTADGTYWCLLTLEVRPEASVRQRGNLIQIVPRVSVPILVSVGQAGAPRLTARFEKTLRQADAVTSWVELENRGPGAVRLAGRVALEEAAGSGPTEVGSMVTERMLLLPGHRRRVSVRLPWRGAPAVRLRGVFDYAAGQAIEIQSPAIP